MEKQLNENVSQCSNEKTVEWVYRKAKCAAIAGANPDVARLTVTDHLLKQYRV
jgi:hypothetical protein